ncbi:MAG: hypothetical protein ACRDJU_00100, partial [Actinomycetota bacterium]
MTEWEESTAKGSIATPAAGQDGMVMPPSAPSFSGGGRRAGLIIALVVILIALGGGGYLLVRSRDHKAAPVSQVAAVRQAYLNWWKARVQEYLSLNPRYVKPFMTPAGYQQEQTLLAQLGSRPLGLVASHNLQVFVYSGGVNASVDDVWQSNSVFLDPGTHQPVGTRSDLTAEDSVSLKKVQGHWLIDSIIRFGQSQAAAGVPLSYAAVDGGMAPSQPVLGQIEASFQRYETVRDSAYLSLDDSRLPQVEAGPELSQD